MTALLRSAKWFMCFVAGGAISTLYHHSAEQASGTPAAKLTPYNTPCPALRVNAPGGVHKGGDANSFTSDVISAANARVDAANKELMALKSAHAKLELALKQARSADATRAVQHDQVSSRGIHPRTMNGTFTRSHKCPQSTRCGDRLCAF